MGYDLGLMRGSHTNPHGVGTFLPWTPLEGRAKVAPFSLLKIGIFPFKISGLVGIFWNSILLNA